MLYDIYDFYISIKLNNIYLMKLFLVLNEILIYLYKTALNIAIENRDHEIVQLLLEHPNIDVNIITI